MIWVTADLHMGHDNIRKFCDRPFDSVEEMDRVLIDNWNCLVSHYDEVYVLGDFTLNDTARHYFCQLKGQINVPEYPWHHDKRWLKKEGRSGDLYSGSNMQIKLLPPMVVLEFPGDDYPLAVTLCHYPLESWDRLHHGALHLHGHIHSKELVTAPNRFDVGVDANNFRPVKLDDILKLAI